VCVCVCVSVCGSVCESVCLSMCDSYTVCVNLSVYLDLMRIWMEPQAVYDVGLQV